MISPNTIATASILLFIIFIILIYYWLELNGNEYLEKLADQLELEYTPSTIKNLSSLDGTYRGIPVRVFSKSKSKENTNDRRLYSVYKVALPKHHVPDGLLIYREGISSKVSKVFGRQDIKIGDKHIDKAFIIQGTDEHQVREFFQRPLVKEYLFALLKQCKHFRLEDGFLHLEYKRWIMRERRAIHRRLELLVKCAHAISGTDPLAPQPQAPQSQAPQPQTTPRPTLPEPAPFKVSPGKSVLPEFIHDEPDNVTNDGDAW